MAAHLCECASLPQWPETRGQARDQRPEAGCGPRAFYGIVVVVVLEVEVELVGGTVVVVVSGTGHSSPVYPS